MKHGIHRHGTCKSNSQVADSLWKAHQSVTEQDLLGPSWAKSFSISFALAPLCYPDNSIQCTFLKFFFFLDRCKDPSPNEGRCEVLHGHEHITPGFLERKD